MAPNLRELWDMVPNIANKVPNIPGKYPSLGDLKGQLPTITTLKDLSNAAPSIWVRCSETKKPEVCEANLKKLRYILGGGTVLAGVAGYYLLPTIGFSVIGPDPGSVAAAWQSSIGIVKAGSLFSMCQSLGMTGTGALMISSTAASLTLLAGVVSAKKLDWCTCEYDKHNAKSKM